MVKMAAVTIMIEKCDSKYVPFSVVYREVEANTDEMRSYVEEQMFIVETAGVELPKLQRRLRIGDRLEFTADFYGEHFSYETDCGTEHDANYEFRNVSDLRVWRCVHERNK